MWWYDEEQIQSHILPYKAQLHTVYLTWLPLSAATQNQKRIFTLN